VRRLQSHLIAAALLEMLVHTSVHLVAEMVQHFYPSNVCFKWHHHIVSIVVGGNVDDKHQANIIGVSQQGQAREPF